MRTELHELCNLSSSLLHKSFSDGENLSDYLLLMNTKEEAGRRIRAARLKKGMRLEDVCTHVAELTVSRLSNWEQGRNMISVDEAKKLSPVIDVSAAYILTIEDNPGHQQEKSLIALYRKSDARGKDAIFHIAERESAYSADRSETSDTEHENGTR